MHDSAPADNDAIYLLDYLEIIVKRKRMVICVTLVVFAVSIAFALLAPRKYSSTALLLPPQQDQGLMGLMMGQMGGGVASLAGDLMGKGSSVDLYARMLESEAIKDAIIDRFNLITQEKTQYRTFAYKLLDKKVQIAVVKKGGLLSITADDQDPKRAAEIANAYVEELERLTVNLNVTGAVRDRTFLEERLTKAKADLARAEDALKGFAVRNKTLDIAEQTKGAIRGVAELEGQLTAEEVKLSGMRRVLTDASQEVKNQQAVIGNLRSQIAKFEGNRSGAALPGVGSVPALAEQYLRLMREFKIQESLVELLTKQYEVAKLSEAKNISTVQVIQRARPQDKSLKPSRKQLVLIPTLAALVGSIFLALLLEHSAQMEAGQKQRLHALFRQLFSFRRAD